MKRIYIYIYFNTYIFITILKTISHFCIHVLVLLLRLSSRMFKSSPLFKNNSYISNDGDRWSIVRVIYAKVENSVSQSRVNAAERFLREAGHAIVAADCHLVWHAMQNYLPFYLSCIHPLARRSIIHLCLDYHYFSSMSILTRRERRVKIHTFSSFLIFSKHQIFKVCFFLFFSFFNNFD